MSKRMLIDARHTEETRVTIVKGNRVEEFDYESASKVQLKGNIYLAKVTRVEPSLQAAFVDYGGNRHGFLAFSEIHPDYYQIPLEDREALLAEEVALMQKEEEEIDKSVEAEIAADANADQSLEKDDDATDKADGEHSDGDQEPAAPLELNSDLPIEGEDDIEHERTDHLRRRQMRALKRRYKIQEVIKPRQILLIQVVKEERGNKGAALTTYLSLAGRYTVLMPNTTQGGGISRKIANPKDRKRLKSILDSIDVDKSMGCIIRTAGMKRTKPEIKRDVEYLNKIWSDIRELTMRSTAPACIYEEANLIKRSIRDLYDRDIDEVQVEGERAYRLAKDFMTLLMPTHAKRVVHYRDRVPLFQRHQIESQLDAIFNPTVTLKSGGYLVINPTEALIAIDVNSGKSTKGHNIEETALKTNLEAADEVARQLRLRDMAGLVVIDFIDMEDNSSIRKVERRLKDALKTDRARVQIGRISQLGLMEVSRQRLRPNLVETSTMSCPHCEGTGRVKTTELAALRILRAIEEESTRARNAILTVKTSHSAALFILNQKRHILSGLEQKYQCRIEIVPQEQTLAAHYEIECSGRNIAPLPRFETITPDVVANEAPKAEPIAVNDDEVTHSVAANDGEEELKPRRRRKRGGRRRGSRGRGRNRFDENGEPIKAEQSDENSEPTKDTASANAEESSQNSSDQAKASSEGQDGKPARRRGNRYPRIRGKRTSHDGVPSETATNIVELVPTGDDSFSTEIATDIKASVEPLILDLTPKAEDTPKDEKKGDKKKTRAPRKKAEKDRETIIDDHDKTESASESKAKTPGRKPRAKKSDEDDKSKPVKKEAKAGKKSDKDKASPTKSKAAATNKTPSANSVEKVQTPETDETKKVSKSETKAKPASKASTPEKTEAEQNEQPAKPKKKGWWQRG